MVNIYKNAYGRIGLAFKESQLIYIRVDNGISEKKIEEFSSTKDFSGLENISSIFEQKIEDKNILKRLSDLNELNELIEFENDFDFIRCAISGDKTAVLLEAVTLNQFNTEFNLRNHENIYDKVFQYVDPSYLDYHSRLQDCFSLTPRKGDLVVVHMAPSLYNYTQDKYKRIYSAYGIMLDDENIISTSHNYSLFSNSVRGKLFKSKLSDFLRCEYAERKYVKAYVYGGFTKFDPIDIREERLKEYEKFICETIVVPQQNNDFPFKSFYDFISWVMVGDDKIYNEIIKKEETRKQNLSFRNKISRINSAIQDANKINSERVGVKHLAETLNVSRQTIYNILNEFFLWKKYSIEYTLKISEKLQIIVPHWIEYGKQYPEFLPLENKESKEFIRKFNDAIKITINNINLTEVEEIRESQFRDLSLLQKYVSQSLAHKNISLSDLNLTDSFYENYLFSSDIKIIEKKIPTLLDIANYYKDSNTSDIKKNGITYEITYEPHRNGNTLTFSKKVNLSNFKLIYNRWNFISEKIEIGDDLLIKLDIKVNVLLDTVKEFLSKTNDSCINLGIYLFRLEKNLILAKASYDSLIDLVLLEFRRNNTDEKILCKIGFNNLVIHQINNVLFAENDTSSRIEVIGKVIQVIKYTETF